jgi:hypothetical protein
LSSSPSYLDPIVLPLIVGTTVLDVGFGYGRRRHLIQSNLWEAGTPEPPVTDGFDAFQPNVEFCRSGNCYRRVKAQLFAGLPRVFPSLGESLVAFKDF